MKRPLFIIIGAVIVFILLGVWVYVLIFSDSTTSDTYSPITIGDTTDSSYNPVQRTEEPTIDVTGPERLRQLTTSPVVGYQEVQVHASSSPLIYYVAAGTGHIFSINLETGEEQRISATTIPSSYKAEITPSGTHALIQSGSGPRADFIIETIGTTSDSTKVSKLAEPIIDFVVTVDNTFLYAIKTESAVIAKEYNPTEETTTIVFIIPFREAVIDWGHTADAIHYVYPKATRQLEGYVYAVVDGTLNRLPIAGYGLSAAGNESGVIYSKQEQGTYNSYIYSNETGETSQIFLSVIPEKCTSLLQDQTTVFCGSADITNASLMPDIWYKGELTFADDLWSFNLASANFTQLTDIKTETGRELEVGELLSNSTDSRLYFINTTSQNLWVFDNAVIR